MIELVPPDQFVSQNTKKKHLQSVPQVAKKTGLLCVTFDSVQHEIFVATALLLTPCDQATREWQAWSESEM